MYRYFPIRFFLSLLVLLIPSIGHACAIVTSTQQIKQTNLPNARLVTFEVILAVFNGTECELSPVFADGKGSVTIAGVTLDLMKTETPASFTNVACPANQIDPRTVRWPFLSVTCGSFYKVIYKLEGTSTNTDPTTTFPCPLKLKATNRRTGTVDIIDLTASSNCIKVPVTTTPTCSFSIDQPNVTLQSIKPADIENLTAGTAVASVQKSINVTVNCAAGALSANATFAPQFSPTKSAVLGNSSVALNDGTDNGTGFKLFDSSGAAMAFNTPLVGSTNTLFSFTPTLPTVTKAFTIKYAKTSQAVTPGPVSSSITVTFSQL